VFSCSVHIDPDTQASKTSTSLGSIYRCVRSIRALPELSGE
jgi:hypothetical protein